MIYIKMIKKDLSAGRVTAAVLFAFIMLSSAAAAAGTALIARISGSVDTLFSVSSTPHFVQMHSGDLDPLTISSFASSCGSVNNFQIAELLTVDSGSITIGSGGGSEAESIMDLSFTRQNSEFDLLTGPDNIPVSLSPGEIALPVYYKQKRGIREGETVTVRQGSFTLGFTVRSFFRDPLMNPAIIHSKRLLVSREDYNTLSGVFREKEYLIEFLLDDPRKAGAFAETYSLSSLPAKGPSLDMALFRVLNSVTDGITAAVIIIAGIVVMVITALSLRFIIIAALESDRRETGVMKAIGIPDSRIEGMYAAKYLAIAAAASGAGYLLSYPAVALFSSGIVLYLGAPSVSAAAAAYPAAASAAVFLASMISCRAVIRRQRKMPAVMALRSGTTGPVNSKKARYIRLGKSPLRDINIFLGIRDILQRPGRYMSVLLVYFFSVFLITTPVSFLTTMKSPSFISYMGIGRSDIRIDLRQGDDSGRIFTGILRHVREDRRVILFQPLVTSRFKVKADDGTWSVINIESGDFSLFPLDYVSGRAPADTGEIALSLMESRERGKNEGDRLLISTPAGDREVRICGIYQDITNGGKTAKALFPPDGENVLAYTVNMALSDDADTGEVIREYREIFSQARVTGIEEYLSQTLGSTISQLEKAAAISALAGTALSALISFLFLRMITGVDSAAIAVMKGLGFPLRDIRKQYLSGTLFLLALGTVSGILFSATAGEKLAGAFWSFLGAGKIQLEADPLLVCLLLPLFLASLVCLAAVFSMSGVREKSISGIINE